MVHAVLSSTLLLCVWEETRHDPECRALQQKVIEIFSDVELETGDPTTAPSNNSQWLSQRHIRAVVALRDAVRSAPLTADNGGARRKAMEHSYNQPRRTDPNTIPADITGEVGTLPHNDPLNSPRGSW